MDFQNRVGSKPGAGAPLSRQDSAVARKERLRKLALESVDLSKDPYIVYNNYGSIECKLCLTLHNNEGNYLAHTQGKRHQQNLAARAARDKAREAVIPQAVKRIEVRKTIKIGRPGYRVVKRRDPETKQRTLFFEIHYPEIEEGLQPRHRFMGAYEQRVEAPNKNYQYLLVAAEPYETIGFKIPADEIDKSPGKVVSNWNQSKQTFTLQISFVASSKKPAAPATPGPVPMLAPGAR